MSTAKRPSPAETVARAALAPGVDEVFAQDVLEGLAKPRKELPCRWFYDQRGSELFEEITDLPEYYPTRTETAILQSCAAELSALVGPGAALLEYGAGAAVKTRILLDRLERLASYAPIDISAEFLRSVVEGLSSDYPDIQMQPIIGNFLSALQIPAGVRSAERRLGFFPGSTIGNLSDGEMTAFFRRARAQLGEEGRLLIGADLRKSAEILIPAYDDAAGVTAAFNKNLLVRINRELGANFDLARFRHEARWNDDDSRVEMHLVSAGAQSVSLLGQSFDFADGETIHTENSRKFEIRALQELAKAGEWELLRVWKDPRDLFSVLLFG